ncbi:MAG: PQQ-dependent sugar dehydrogenase [Bryobacteraceae bacterium]|nr:PQQ-dependent sugar dehydrogenase [Bryobacteraceae bacterium]
MRLAVVLALLILPALDAQQVRLTPAPGRSLPQITDIQSPGDGSGRLMLVQMRGQIWIRRNDAVLDTPFLDITTRTAPGGERGLLGMAFPPDFARKQYFYVNYTDLRGDTVVSRFRVSVSNRDAADASSEQILLTIDQPFANHNGGQLQFGPDGFLYIGTGDGGSGGDPQNNGQRTDTLLGKMLRIDVESDLAQYRVPPSNPFVGNASYRPEIWATGLRNPWRYAFDRATGDLWTSDVGQNRAEEVNFQPASSRGGENYGWRLMEGLQCFVAGCNTAGLTMPVLEYGRGLGCSVSGGYVYRGARYPGLRGMYLYSDFCSGRVWGVRREGAAWVNRELLNSGRTIATFGQDQDGELFTADFNSGVLFRIESSTAPFFTPAAVVNAASNRAGLVAGSLATVYAAGVRDTAGIEGAASLPLPATLGGVRITVGGIPAPILSVSNTNGLEQVNFQVPFEVAGRDRVQVVVTRNGASDPVDLPLSTVQPGVFTADGTRAIIVDAIENRVVEAMERGRLYYFYATGLGAVSNAPPTGAAAPRNPLAQTRAGTQVRIGTTTAEVQYSGLAPDFAGLYQINIRVADNTPPGAADLVLAVGGAESTAVRVTVR